MKSPTFMLAAALLATAGLAPALAADEAAPAADEACRIAELPAGAKAVQRIVQEPPLRERRRVPVYETRSEPVYEMRRVPVYETREVPVYETVEVPVYRIERVPVYGEKQVPAYREVRKPVTIEIWNPFACENECLELWDTCERVEDGTRTVRTVLRHEERRVPNGTRTEQRRTGTRSEQVMTGFRCEQVQVGERTKQVCVGHEMRLVVVRPARERIVTESTAAPPERVTVIPDGTRRTTPLAGTTRILTRSQYEAALASRGD